jgi:hypothetical protein
MREEGKEESVLANPFRFKLCITAKLLWFKLCKVNFQINKIAVLFLN